MREKSRKKTRDQERERPTNKRERERTRKADRQTGERDIKCHTFLDPPTRAKPKGGKIARERSVCKG